MILLVVLIDKYINKTQIIIAIVRLVNIFGPLMNSIKVIYFNNKVTEK